MVSTLTQRYLMYISYIGSGFRGSQIQNKTLDYTSNTIQGTVSATLSKLLNISQNNLIRTCFTSRTDAGVHALKNGVHFDLPIVKGQFLHCDSIKNFLNHKFIKNNIKIRVIEVLKVPDVFHARYSSYEKTYIYRIAIPNQNTEKCNFPLFESDRTFFLSCKDIDLEKIKEVVKLYVGEKDFGAFVAKSSKNQRPTVCKLTSFEFNKSLPLMEDMEDWYPKGVRFHYYHFTCTGNKYLLHMIRRLVGTALTVGKLRLSLTDVQKMFDKPEYSSWDNRIHVVPGHGLYLADIKFQSDHLIINEEEKKRKNELLNKKLIINEI